MAFSKQIQLLERLIEKTEAGGLDWKRTVNDGVFQLSLRKNTLKLRADVIPGHATDSYVIEMLDSSGEVADVFNDSDLDHEVFGASDRDFYKRMKDLYEMARRQAFGSDRILNEILKDLG